MEYNLSQHSNAHTFIMGLLDMGSAQFPSMVSQIIAFICFVFFESFMHGVHLWPATKRSRAA
jgi:hypothetical protein